MSRFTRSQPSLPKNFDELLTIFFALSLTDSDTLGKPIQADGKETGVFHFEASADQTGPYYDLVMGDPSQSNFGNAFTLRVSLNRNSRSTQSETSFGFLRLANGQWMFDDKVKLAGLESRICPDEITSVINNAFAHFFSEQHGSDSVPEQFEDEVVPLVAPTLSNTGILSTLEKERAIEEDKEERRLEAEAAARREKLRLEQVARQQQELLRQQEVARQQEIARQQELTRQEQLRRDIEEKARQEKLRLEQVAREAAEKVRSQQSAQNAKLIANKVMFNRILTVNKVQPTGLLYEKTHLSASDFNLIGQFVQDHGKTVVAQWWTDYKNAPKSQIDF